MPTKPPRLSVSLYVVCKEAKADLAFLVDGSWSIGDDNFMKITRFLYSTVGSLDLIGPDGTQVSHVATHPERACSMCYMLEFSLDHLDLYNVAVSLQIVAFMTTKGH